MSLVCGVCCENTQICVEAERSMYGLILRGCGVSGKSGGSSWYELIAYCIPGPSQWHLEAVMLRLSRDRGILG